MIKPSRFARIYRVFKIDLRALAAMRIGLGLVSLLDLADRSRLLKIYYTDSGVLPRALNSEGAPKFSSIYLWNGSYGYARAMFTIHVVLAFMLMIGFRARFAAVGVFVMMWSLTQRAQTITTGGDYLLLWLLIWSAFLPISARGSVDALLARRNQSAGSSPTLPRRIASVATVAILLQMAFVYLSALVVKTEPAWTQDFDAVYYFLTCYLATPIGYALAHWPMVTIALTIMTLAIELVGAPLALLTFDMPRARTLITSLLICFHLGMAACMYLSFFSYDCIVGWLVFFPSPFWDAIERAKIGQSVIRLWRAIIKLIASMLARVARIIPLIAPRTIWDGQEGASLYFAGALFAYIICVNAVYDIPRSVRGYLGPIQHIPRLKQAWGVMDVTIRYMEFVTIDVDLADGTTHRLRATDARDGSFWYTLPRADSMQDEWSGSLWPGEASRAAEFRSHILAGASRGRSEFVATWSQWHRRKWNSEHPPAQQIVALRTSCQLRPTPTPDEALGKHSTDESKIQTTIIYRWPEPAQTLH